MPETREGIRNAVELLFVGSKKFLRFRTGVVDGIMIGKERSIQVLAVFNLCQLWRIPTVAAEQRNVEPLLLGLLRDESDCRVVAGNENRLGTFCLDRCELSVKVGIAAAIA